MIRWLCAALLILCIASGCGLRSPQSSYDRIRADYRAGKLVAARAELERGRTSWRRSLSPEWDWRFRLLEAEVMLAQVEPLRALDLLQRESSAPTPELETRRLAGLADAFAKLDRIEEAQRALAEASGRAAVGNWADLQMHLALIEGSLCTRLQEYSRAEAVSLRLRERADAARDDYFRAGARINLSFNALRQKRFDDAVARAREALDIARSAGAIRFAAVAALNLASAYGELGDFDAAREMQKLVSQSFESTGDYRNLHLSLGELANMLVRQGDLRPAVPLYEKAFQIAQERGMNSSAQRWARNLTQTLLQMNDWTRAGQWNEKARSLSHSVEPTSMLYLELNEGIIATGNRDFRTARQKLLHVRENSQDNPTLAWEAEASLARLARAAGDLAESNRRYAAAIRLIDGALGQIQETQFRVTFRARLIGMYRDYVASLLEQGAVERAFEVAESSRAQLLAQKLGKLMPGRPHATARSLLALAKSTGYTFVSYWIAPGKSVVWILSPRGIAMEPLPGLEQISSAAESYKNEVLDGLGDPLLQPAGALLSKALLEPVSRHLAPGARVVVAPDGPVHQINLETLPAPGATRRYWIEDASLTLTPSLALLEASPPAAPRSALLIGAPTFASAEFPTLRHASEELRIVRSRLSRVPATVFEGASATPAAYLREAPRLHSIIHFAAHGDVRYENPFDSAIILSGTGGEERLRGRDIAAQPLNAELVTVSACKSAGARSFAGEGLTGLAWAFLQSGARRVVAGSWDVSDQSSAMLMDRMYRGLNAGEDPGEALRQAKLTLLHSGTGMRQPFYWAALQMYVRVIPDQKKGTART